MLQASQVLTQFKTSQSFGLFEWFKEKCILEVFIVQDKHIERMKRAPHPAAEFTAVFMDHLQMTWKDLVSARCSDIFISSFCPTLDMVHRRSNLQIPEQFPGISEWYHWTHTPCVWILRWPRGPLLSSPTTSSPAALSDSGSFSSFFSSYILMLLLLGPSSTTTATFLSTLSITMS